jgi:glycosyltransferase involved in cell wall biosynthesis
VRNGNHPRVTFVVNGDPTSAMAERADSFACRLGRRFDCRIVFRTGGRLGAAGRMFREIAAARPDLCYVLDLAFAGVVAAGAYQCISGTPFVLDTGDAVVELGRALGRGPAALAATRALETYALRAAAAVVVRGSYHRDLLARRSVRAEFIPDGVEVDRFAPPGPPGPKPPGCPLVIGLIGNVVWVPARQTCYGWELVEVIRLLHQRLAIRGVLIGDGSGVEVLKRRCVEYGIETLVEFVGCVPYAELPRRLRGFDICLSTQTNDVIGNVRTTGKLPIYLAAGRFVLASNVGEAARVLPAEMLVEFTGASDTDYPRKLAERVTEFAELWAAPKWFETSVSLARQLFDYDRLAEHVRSVLDRCLARRRRPAAAERLGSRG